MESLLAPGPLSPSTILRTTWNLYRRHWRAWLALSLLTYVPYYLMVQISNISADSGQNAFWSLMVPVTMVFQALVMNGAGAIYVADGLRGERPTLWYALDLLFTQRLGRVLLMWLFTAIVTDVVSLPLLPLTLLGTLPYERAIVIVDALPWIAGIGLLIFAVALIATRQQRSIPLFLVVAFVIGYSIFVIHVPDQSRDFQNAVLLFSQGARLVLNTLFLLFLPIVAIDPGPLWRTAARGWRIAKENLPLILAVVFLLGLGTSLLENLGQTVAYLLPGLLAANRTMFIGPWQVQTSYVNALIYYLPLSLVFIAAVFTPLQAVFATIVTLDGYWLFGTDDEDEEWEDEEGEEDDETDMEGADDALESDIEAAEVSVLEASFEESGPPVSDEAFELEEDEEDLDEDTQEPKNDVEDLASRPLVTYRDLIYFALMLAVGTGLSYLSNTVLNAFIGWLNQLFA